MWLRSHLKLVAPKVLLYDFWPRSAISEYRSSFVSLVTACEKCSHSLQISELSTLLRGSNSH